MSGYTRIMRLRTSRTAPAERPRELDAQVRELNSRLLLIDWSIRSVRARSNTVEGRFATDRVVVNVENAFLGCQRISGGRIHRHPHVTAKDLRIHVGEAE